MTDLDTFRAALQGQDDGRPPAVDDIVNAGRKLRLKRRLVTATIVAASVVAATGSTAAIWHAQASPPSRPRPRPARPRPGRR